MADNTPLSYQTTYPKYPDVSWDAYKKLYGGRDNASRFNVMANAWFHGSPNYETWRTNLLDKYNADLAAYNTWLSSGAGMRASAESGQYNPSYFSNGSASASPLNYQDVDPGSGVSELSSGISGVVSFAKLLQGLAMTSAQIRGIELENEGKSIENRFLPSLLEFKKSKLGYDVDWSNLQTSAELYSRYKDMPELWSNGLFSTGNSTYDLRNADKGLMYQKAQSDIDFVRAGVALRNIQSDMTHWSSKEKEFYVNNMQSIEKDLLSGKKTITEAEADLYKSARITGIGNDVVRTIVSLLSLLVVHRRGM